MKKRFFSMTLCLIMVFALVQFKTIQIDAKETSNLSTQEIITYKNIIESYIKTFGIADVEYIDGTITPTSKNGVGFVEFIDFDKNGSLEMILVYNYNHIYRCLVYSCMSNGAVCLYSDICTNMMGSMMELYLYENDTNVYTIVDYCIFSEKDRTSTGTLMDGEWIVTNYFDSQDGLSYDILQNRKAIFYTKENSPQTILDILNNNLTKVSHLDNKINYLDEIRYSYIAQLHFLYAKSDAYGNLTSDDIYYIYDINKDSIPELILKQGTCEADYKFKVFSYVNGISAFFGELPGGHRTLYGVNEPEILLSYAHHGYERIYQSKLEGEKISNPNVIYEEDSTKKEYTYVDNVDSFRNGAYKLESSAISNLDLLNSYFVKQKELPIIQVVVNDKKIVFDQNPIIIQNRTLVPLRAIFEELGAEVNWDGDTRTVTSTKGQTTISMSVGKTEMYKNGDLITLDVVPQLLGGRTLVPVRAVAEGFDCKVDWDDEYQTVIIKTIDAEE